MTHAHAAAADWLALASARRRADLRLAALLEPLGHLAWDTLGAGAFPIPQGIARWDAAAFVAAMEAEDESRRRRRPRRARRRRDLRRAAAGAGRAALAHYADFGHSAIYVLKAGQLIERLGERCSCADAAGADPPAGLRPARGPAARVPRLRPGAGGLGRTRARGRPAPRTSSACRSLAMLAARSALVRPRRRASCSTRCWAPAAWNLLHFDLALRPGRRAARSPTTSAGSTSPTR